MFHHLSSRFTAGWKTEEEKREKTEGEIMKTPPKWRTTASGKSINPNRSLEYPHSVVLLIIY